MFSRKRASSNPVSPPLQLDPLDGIFCAEALLTPFYSPVSSKLLQVLLRPLRLHKLSSPIELLLETFPMPPPPPLYGLILPLQHQLARYKLSGCKEEALFLQMGVHLIDQDYRGGVAVGH